MIMALLLLLLFFFLLPSTQSSCHVDRTTLSLAFSSVTNFQPITNCTTNHPLHQLILPSRNLTGPVSWKLLGTISTLRVIDLSNNSLDGSLPTAFWSSLLEQVNLADNRLGGTLRFGPSGTVQSLNLSGNRFTGAVGLSGLSGLQRLDLSRNRFALVPPGLDRLRSLGYLDVSSNSMEGAFPRDFHPTSRLRFLNVSINNLTGKVSPSDLRKFGRLAFVEAGNLTFPSANNYTLHTHSSSPRRVRRFSVVLSAIVASSVIIVLAICVFFVIIKKRRRRRRNWGWKEEERGGEVEEWVAEARWTAPVVMFEKPLMELRFADLATATSGFGRESQLAEGGGRSGPAYRGVLQPGDVHVVVRVAEGMRAVEEGVAAEKFREVSRLRHRNLLPLLGYCIAGKEKLLLYEYMEHGDLHRWLHDKLTIARPDAEDWSADAWDPHYNTDKRTTTTSSAAMSEDWPTRRRIALGIARGLAFLHQGCAVVHGHLVPTNILLGDDLEPRIADFFTYGDFRGANEITSEDDVYAYGLLLMEVVTGKGGRSGEEVERLRKLVKDGRGVDLVGGGMRMEVEGSGMKWEKEMVETLGVAYLCTARSPEKRPTMQQIVGLLKDIGPSPASTADNATNSSSSCN